MTARNTVKGSRKEKTGVCMGTAKEVVAPATCSVVGGPAAAASASAGGL